MTKKHTKIQIRTMKRIKQKALHTALVFLPVFLTGCAGNITGLVGAQEDFGCPASGGVNCTTVSATYEREHADDVKSEVKTLTGVDSANNNDTLGREPIRNDRIAVTSTPVEADRRFNGPIKHQDLSPRAPERLVMLWILPWVDAAGDLHSDSRVWMRVRDAAWRIESVRTRAMRVAPETAP